MNVQEIALNKVAIEPKTTKAFFDEKVIEIIFELLSL